MSANRAITAAVFRSTPDTATINNLLKTSGQAMQALAEENSSLHQKLSAQKKESSEMQRELGLYKVAHDLAKRGNFKPGHVTVKVSQWMREGRSPAQVQELYAIGAERSAVAAPNSGTKTSSVRSQGVAESGRPVHSDNKSMAPWMNFVEALFDD